MTTTDPRAAAIEAFKAAWEDADRRGEKGHRTEAGMAAAVPHLTAGPRALADEWSEPIGYDFRDLIRLCCAHELREALDALEWGGDRG